MLPPGSAEPGPYRSERTPYCVPFMRACVDPRYQRVVVIMGSQSGKTASVFNVIGHRLDDDPAPIIYVGPTKSNIEKVVEPKIVEMVRSAAGLREKFAASNRQSSKTAKRVGGVQLRLAWAGSATELAADAAAMVFVDELDKVARNNEGDVVEQSEARTGTYPDGKVIATSTPTEGTLETERHSLTGIEHWKVSDRVGSPIWRLWQEGTRHEWAVPCPHCADYFVPRLKYLRWPKDGSVHERARAARLLHSDCGGLIEDWHKHTMNAAGRAIAPGQRIENGAVVGTADTAENPTYSLWASGLMAFSPKKTFEFLARKLIRAYESGEPDRVQGVINTDFGECFAVAGEAPPVAAVAACRGDYGLGALPADTQLLTAGVDVQKNRLVYVVRAWALGGQSRLIDYGELWGDTDRDEVWNDLAGVLTLRHGEHFIRRMMVDAGFRPTPVYAFCQQYPQVAVPTRGRDHLSRPVYAVAIEVGGDGKAPKRSIQLWHVDSDIAKSWVHARIKEASDPDKPRRVWSIPDEADDDYCQQLINEQRIVKPSGKAIWVKQGENHYLDAEALAYMSMKSLGVERQLLQAPVAAEAKVPEPAAQQSGRSPRSGWLDRGGRGGSGGWLNRG